MIRTLLNGSVWTLTGGGHDCPAIVPGSVHDALVAAELIPDSDSDERHNVVPHKMGVTHHNDLLR